MDYKQNGNLTIKDSIDRYIDNKSLNGLLSATTIENRKIELFRFERFCKQNKITEPDNLHKNHLAEYLKRLKTSNGTKQTLINIYRSFFDFLVDEELILDNIAATIKPPKTNRPAPDYLTYEELEMIYQSEAINASSKVVDRNLLILSMLVEMGLRVSEMIGIKLSDLDLEAKQVWVTKKGGVTKKTPFNDSIKNQIETWLSFRPHFKNSEKEDRLFLATTGKGLNRKQVYEIISNAIDRAGLVKKKKGPHLLRHTGATLRSMRGDDIETIRVWLDHKSYAMSQIYNHAGKALLQKTVENELLKDKEKYRKGR
jgi:integrase/recombinase XerD